MDFVKLVFVCTLVAALLITSQGQENSAKYWLEKGQALSSNASYQEALSSFNRSLALDSRQAGAWTGKGDVLYKLGRYETAANCYDQAVGIDSENPIAWEGKGMAASKLGRYKLAKLSFDAALRLVPYYR
ncbi:Tetratricopeptide repeat protein [uncultured archaeon]|nr:Tetratricopeptide repeat protein [uncultured archaeon]